MLHEDSGANENMSEKLSLENELLCVVKRISKMCFFFLISLIKLDYLSNSLHLRVTFFRTSRLKVSKSQRHFFLKLYCPKNELNIWQNSALASKGRILFNISFIFWAMEFQEKLLFRFTDL